MCPRFQIVRCVRASWFAHYAVQFDNVEECLQGLKRCAERLVMSELKLRPPKRHVLFARCIVALLLGMIALCAAPARAQQPPPDAVGEVEGNDVTVDGGTPAMVGTSTNAPKIFVSSGSVLTVHSGQAVMTLFAGGEVDICGPAKITILRASDAITLALNFGRMRVQLPPKTSLRVFTPTVVGTPLDISGGARDVTVGLSLDDSMCVLASSGAIQLANQFTDQTLIVPQSGEFFLSAGQLQPVAGKPGSCQCTAARPPPPPAPAEIPEFAQTAPATPMPRNLTEVVPLAAPPVTVPEFTQAIPATPEPRGPSNVAPLTSPPAIADQPPAGVLPAPQPGEPPAPRIEYSVPASVSEAHPVMPTAKQAPETGAPTVAGAANTTVVPMLAFSASAPEPLGDPTPDMALLIRTARVEPEWGFTGTVAAPEFVAAMQQSLGVQPGKEPSGADAAPQRKKGGFWAGLKRLFGGGKGQ
jgi:hypothetical protein